MQTYNNIAHWRTEIFSRLLSVVTLLGTIAAVPSVFLAWREGLWNLIAMDAVALLWIVGLWRARRMPYTLRVLNFLAVLYLTGIGLMLTVGPVSQIYLLAPPVMASVLLSRRAAVLALLGSALTILALSLSGHAKLYVAGMPGNVLAQSLIVTLNFVCVALLITLSCDTLLKRLAASLDHVHTVAGSLQQLNAELRLNAAAVANLNDMVLIAEVAPAPGAEAPIIFANDAFERRTGWRRSEVDGRSMRMLHGPDTDDAEVVRIAQAMARGEPVESELLHYTRNGEPFWVELELVPFADEGGNNTHWVAVGRDITERRKSETAIHRLAFYDVLTGLPNRRMLMDRLEHLLAQAQAGGSFGAVMFIDLDHFKLINDARGHATGDAVLRDAADRLAALVRDGDTVARLGGDEFVVLLAHLGRDVESATRASLRVAEKIRAALAAGTEVGGHTYAPSASIGVSLLPRAGQSALDLLREADTAMYRAKAKGRNGVAFFEERMQADMERRLTLERDLAAALEHGELAMHYQLQVDSQGAPAGAELLMRWRRADGAMVPPDVFIPVAETTGLIVPLGQWALREACRASLRLEACGHALPLSVNVSPVQFRQAGFVEQVRAVLAETGADAARLIFEVTEGLLVDSRDSTIARMHELAALGIRFSIDDFGTGYSNLGYLKRMPLFELKIDKSFIRDTPGDANGTAIVQSMLAMAAHLDLRVVAEGVETDEQAGFLRTQGAPHMQGYLFSRPAPLAELLAALDARSARPAEAL